MRLSTSALVACCALALGAATPVSAAPEPGTWTEGDFLTRLLAEATRVLEEQAATRRPAFEPPVSVPVTWKPTKLASIDLKAPLLALEVVDLDADDRAELLALTTKELIVLSRSSAKKISVIARSPLPRTLAAPRPRDPVGTLQIARRESGAVHIFARSSMRSRGVVFVLVKGSLVELRKTDGFPLCGARATAVLEPGRNYFAAAGVTWAEGEPAMTVPSTFFAAECNEALVQPDGRPQRVFSVVGTDGTLSVRLDRECGGGPLACKGSPTRTAQLKRIGTAFEIADIDNDGHVEALVSGDRPPGQGDIVEVFSLTGTRWQRVFRHVFPGGIVALAAGDIDGDGDVDGVAALRLIGSNRVDLWTLN